METADDAISIASKLAVDGDLKRRIQDDILELAKRKKDLACHFCGSNPGCAGHEVKVSMYKAVEFLITGLRHKTIAIPVPRYKTIAIPVPRCSTCHSLHQKHRRFAGLGVILGFLAGGLVVPWAAVVGTAVVTLIAGFSLTVIAGRQDLDRVVGVLFLGSIGTAIAILNSANEPVFQERWLNMIGGAVVFGSIGFWLGKKLFIKETPESICESYGPIVELRHDGWNMGDKPLQ